MVEADLLEGRLTLLGQNNSLRHPHDWLAKTAPELWRLELHGWNWAWALARMKDRASARRQFSRFFADWRGSCSVGVGSAWSPYAVALRCWNWTGLFESLVKGSEIERQFGEALAEGSEYLRWTRELHLGGNHLIKDLKADIATALFFGRTGCFDRARRRLENQVTRQILADGGHVERSPFYHAQVLMDLLDVSHLLRTVGVPSPTIETGSQRMTVWMNQMLLPDGTLPMLNDGFGLKDKTQCVIRCERSTAPGVTLLADSGYVVVKTGRLQAILDIGPLGPRHPAGHGHADSLSFVLSANEQLVLTDTGTSTYDNSLRRQLERSTAAHNTVTVDGRNSSEVWGAFRTGKRATVRLLRAEFVDGVALVEAEHSGYLRHGTGPVHRRQWVISENRVDITDHLDGPHAFRAQIAYHISPDVSATLGSDGIVQLETPLGMRLQLTLCGASPWLDDSTLCATGFEQLAHSSTVLGSASGSSLTIRARIELNKDGTPGQEEP